MNQVIQQNAAGAEEAASTSEELLSQAEQLQSTIDFFKVETGLMRQNAKFQQPKKGEEKSLDKSKLYKAAGEASKIISDKQKSESEKLAMEVNSNGENYDDEFEKF